MFWVPPKTSSRMLVHLQLFVQSIMIHKVHGRTFFSTFLSLSLLAILGVNPEWHELATALVLVA